MGRGGGRILERKEMRIKIFVGESEGKNLGVQQNTVINCPYSHMFVVRVCFRYF